MTSDCLIVFTRYPTVGQVKTRLIPAVGAERAAQLHRQMTEHTLAQVQILQATAAVAGEVYFTGACTSADMATWLGTSWHYYPQAAGDLGWRMAQASRAAFQAGRERVVIIGTDCPGLNVAILHDAFRRLLTHDIVLGPAIDGGYYLIGVRSWRPELFQDIPWSTDQVLTQTIAVAHQLQLSIALLPWLADVDRPADLSVWEEACSGQDRRLISVIIPARNEASNIARTINSARANSVEIIVVDGSSIDETKVIAQSQGATVISQSPGRAAQMNAGAAGAQGDILLFLHGDTLLPPGYAEEVHRMLPLEQSQPIAGAFRLQIDGVAIGLRVIEWGVQWRSRFFQMPYGDQALFLRTETFGKIGGFPDMPLMEDFELVSRLQRWGTIAISPLPVITAGRRWLSRGIIITTILNQLIVVAYQLGVPPQQLAQWYRQPLRQKPQESLSVREHLHPNSKHTEP